jgi:hypothetical protein
MSNRGIAISLMPRRIAHVLRKIAELSWRDRFLHLEVLLHLAVVSPAIRLLPFRLVGWLASRPVRRAESDSAVQTQTIARIRWAIRRCAIRVPWTAVCFQQGLTAQLMLRRRGIDATLYFGAAMHPKEGLNAHVWVRVGGTDVIGTENAADFAVLAKFPGSP